MVQLVFVHGVATRSTSTADPGVGIRYQADLARRERSFASLTFHGQDLSIRNPYWGNLGAEPAWGLASVPSFDGSHEELSLFGQRLPTTSANQPLLPLAHQDLPRLVNSLALAASETVPDGTAIGSEDAFWENAVRYAYENPNPPWLSAALTDGELLDNLAIQVSAFLGGGSPEELGASSWIHRSADRLAVGVADLIHSPFGRIGRQSLSPPIAVFLGDVLRYMIPEVRRGIQDGIASALMDAVRAADGSEPFILVGHSLGGVILYDLLSDVARTTEMGEHLGREFRADLLLTVGSQVGYFEEIKPFDTSDPGLRQPRKVPRPATVKDWWNVYDRMDVLSFLAEPVFDGVSDWSVNTLSGIRNAHGAYFKSPLFYLRLRGRLKDAGLLT